MWKSTFAAILLAVLLAGPSTAQQNQVKPAAAAETLQTMLKAQVFGPEWLLSKGLSGDLDVRNWRRLAQKLATAGSKIKIVAFGGSVTAGHLPEARNGSWVDQMQVWLTAAFPVVRFETLKLARGSTVVTAASTCWYKHVPGDADLILIEYSANGCTELQCTSIISPLVADYESLMRRVIRRAPNAALMSMAIFAFISQTITARNGEPVKLPYPWFATGEDMHGMLARRYGVPLVSVRDALYDVMWDDAALKSVLGYGRAKIMKDPIHPTFIGHDLYGRGLVAWAMRYILSRELSVLSTSLPPSHDDDAAGYSATEIAAGRAQYSDDNNSNHRVTNQPRKPFGSGSDLPLPQPVSPVAAREADGDPFCAEGAWFRDYAVKGSVTEHGWEWVDGTTPLNLQHCLHFNCHRLGYRAEGATKSLDILVDTTNVTAQTSLDKLALVIFFTKSSSPNTQGVARVTCVSGCRCTPFELDGFNRDATLGAGSTKVTAHRRCLVRVTILHKTTSGGRLFKVDGVAVVPYTDARPMTSIDRMALRGGAV